MVFPAFTKTKKFRIAAVFFLVAVVVGVTFGFYQFYKVAPDLTKVKPSFVLTSSELYSAFETDEKSANTEYIGKVLEVSGKVAQVEFGSIDSSLNIVLREDDQFSGVICTFSRNMRQSAASVNIGDKVSIRGECSGMLLDVLLNNCALMKDTE